MQLIRKTGLVLLQNDPRRYWFRTATERSEYAAAHEIRRKSG